jgi:tRNA threonylcarbamoyl adenosine modification protein YjeE
VTLPARVEVRAVGPESAAQVRAVVLPAFQARPPLDPPAAALSETEEMMAELLSHHGGLIASFEGEDVGALVLDPVGSTMYLRRFGVDPSHQGHGVARALIDAAVEAAVGYEDLTVVAREELPNTIQFWERQGFREILREEPNVELRRPLRTFIFDVPDAPAMRELGAGLAKELTAGDLIVLSGELGAGKTTFTQGLGEGLGVRGDVTSPTFVIARVHPSLGDGPDLVHVDAYRLGGIHELDDLDLDTSLDDAVTVVEWGEGVAEGLAESRLEIRIIRALAHEDEHEDLDPRRVLMTPIGPRWHDLRVPSSQRPPLAEKVNETLLLDFRPCAEDELDGLDPTIPLRLSLMTARHGGRVLMVRNVRSGEWELPGGPILDGETPRRTAERRLVEETRVPPAGVAFVGIATVQIGHARDIEFIALFRTTLEDAPSIDRGPDDRELAWWDPTSELDGLSPIDAHLAWLSVQDH